MIAWTVRRVLPADIEPILALEQGSIEAPHWSKEVWKEIFAQNTEDNPKRVAFVAEAQGRIIGFVVVSCACGEAELESVAVIEQERRRGVGRALCNEALGWARRRLAQVIGLEVRASSVGALALYSSLGFVEQGERPGYYRNPIEDAVIMSASLECSAMPGTVQKKNRGRSISPATWSKWP